MNTDIPTPRNEQLLLLKLRNAIADKEFVTAAANREITHYGEWQCDHAASQRFYEMQIDALIIELQKDPST